MTDAIPTHIGKYEIVELVGEGAMGTVYRAVDSVIGRTVAIKVMNASIAREKDHRQRFLREAQAAGSLQHPNVVTIYDLGELDGHLFIAMEFVHGADLEKLMSLTEPLKLQSKLDIIVDVLMGLSYAHKHGIVHRDIKPANIRVGEDGRAKIMDFGVAHLASSDMTRTGIVVGTPSYMAPEQVTGGKTIPQTDVFAVGALLYHLLSGSKPFEGPTLQSLFYRIVTDMPRPMGELKPGLPPALDRITQKAMAKDPAHRYANALDMANEIIAVRSELSGNAYPASSASLTAAAVSIAGSSGQQPAAKPPRRIHPYAGMAAAAALVVVAWLALGQGARDDAATASNSARPDSALTAAAPVAIGEPLSVSANSVTDTIARAVTPPAPLEEAPAEPRPTPSRASAETKKSSRKTEPPPRPSAAAVRAEEQRKREARLKATATRSAATIGVSSPRVTEPAPRITSPGTQTALLPPPVRIPETRAAVVPPPAPTVRETVSPPPAAPPAPEPREAVASAVQSYARAIESRDISAVRRAYPGISGDQARGFEQFFQASRSINVSFRVASLETSGNTADARLVGSYEYITVSGKSERQPVSFDATLRYDGSAWRLTSVR